MTIAAFKPIGIIKQLPQDFVVQEIAAGEVVPLVTDSILSGAVSPFTSFIMTKCQMETVAACKEVAKQLGVSQSAVTAYGKKDSYAVTSQMIVVAGNFSPSFEHERIWLEQVGPAAAPLVRGRNDGNKFAITVRTDSYVYPKRQTVFRNFFGPQRFGDGSIEVGKDLLEGKFTKALERLRESMNWPEFAQVMRQGHSAMEALFHPHFRDTLTFKLQQWQSWLWNQLASDSSEHRLPVWSFETADLYDEWWSPEEIDAGVHELIHPFSRRVMISAKEATVRKCPGGFLHEFQLPSGVYATVYLSSLYELRDASREKFDTL